MVLNANWTPRAIEALRVYGEARYEAGKGQGIFEERERLKHPAEGAD